MSVYMRKSGTWYMDFRIGSDIRIHEACRPHPDLPPFKGKANKTKAKQAERTKYDEVIEDLMSGKIQTSKSRKSPEMLRLDDAIELGYNSRWSKRKTGDETKRKLIYCRQILGNVYISDINYKTIIDLKTALGQPEEKEGFIWDITEKDDGTRIRKKVRIKKEVFREPGTINRYLAWLKALLNMAVDEWKIIESFPKIKLLKEPKRSRRKISVQEEEKVYELLQQSDNLRYRDMVDLFKVLFDTGMRLDEALLMRYNKNINFDAKEINLDGKITKSGMPRTIPMTERVYGVLFERQDKVDTQRPFTDTIWYCDDVWDDIRFQMRLEEDDRFVIHAIRHTFASRLDDKGISINVIKDLLGHASVKTTELYLHGNDKQHKKAIDTL